MENAQKDMVTDAVLSYLARRNANYGIVLTGKWGCGKTFYWKNVLAKKISGTEFSSLYVSVNGLNSTEALARKILMGLAKNKSRGVVSEKGKDILGVLAAVAQPVTKGIGAAADTIGNAVGLTSDLLHVELKTESILDMLDFSRHILCIDDMERYRGVMEELMGFCNNLLEHKGAHIVFIANEEKMDEHFSTVKEKVIGKTVQCNLDARTIVGKLLEQARKMNPKANDFLKEHMDVILDVMQRSGERNYRAVNVLIGDFQEVYGKIEGLPHSEQELETAWKALLKFMMASGFEILAKGISQKKIDELKDPSNAGLGEMVAAVGNKKTDASYFPLFKKQYYGGYPLKREFFPSVIRLLTEGIVNVEELKREFLLFHKNEPSVCELVLSGRFRDMSDEEFDQKIKGEQLDDIEGGKAPLECYRRLFMHFVAFIQMGLLDLSVHDLKEKFLRGLEQIREADQEQPFEWTPDARSAETVQVETWFSKHASNDLPAYKELDEAVNQTAVHLMGSKKAEPDWFMNELDNNFEKAMKLAEPYIHGECTEEPLFQGAEPEKLYGILLRQTNRDIQAFRQLVGSRFYCGTSEGSRTDDRFLLELAHLIREKIPADQERKLSEVLLLELAGDIERSRKREAEEDA